MKSKFIASNAINHVDLYFLLICFDILHVIISILLYRYWKDTSNIENTIAETILANKRKYDHFRAIYNNASNSFVNFPQIPFR